MKKKCNKLIVPAVYVSVVGIMVVSVVMILNGIQSFVNDNVDYKYTLDTILNDDLTIPVINAKESSTIIRPYVSYTVKISKYFYDYESDVNEQENAIVYYENTYIQNSGVDYSDTESFDVVSILDGEVIELKDDEVFGKIVTIKHNDNLTTIYSGVKDVLINTGYKVTQGEIIAESGVSKINDTQNSSLHFEVYYKGEAIDPENLYTLSVEDFR